jgi:hypothetical protein
MTVPLAIRTLLCATLLLVGVSPALAQYIPRPPDVDSVRVRIGPVYLSPSLALTNLGVDTNVFNEPDAQTPERDLTITMTPATDAWLRLGRSWIVGNVKEDLVWYKKFEAQRSANGSYGATWLLPFNRLTAAVGGNWVSTRDRPGFEIDARARRSERAGRAAVEVRGLSKTFFGARVERRSVEFAESEAFLGTSLSTELNRTVTTGGITVRNELTPLTSITFSAGLEQERFDASPLRDSDSTRFDVSLTFDPFALISGSATIGVRDFKPLSPDLPGYTGSTASANLSYTALGSTKLVVGINRDVQYSFDVNQPYYLQTGINGSMAQQIYGPLDVEFRIGAGRLAYADREGASVAAVDRVDRVRTYGGGTGYRLGRDVRVGFNIDHTERQSELPQRQYEGLRYGLTLTYGL